MLLVSPLWAAYGQRMGSVVFGYVIAGVGNEGWGGGEGEAPTVQFRVQISDRTYLIKTARAAFSRENT